MNTRHLSLMCLITLGLTVLGGCKSNSVVRGHYALNTNRGDRSPRTPSAAILDVRRLTIDAAYESKRLVYRRGQAQYETDYYSEFLVAPARLVTDRLRNWITKAGLCTRVLDASSLVEPTHSLEGHIVRLYGDYRDQNARQAVMEIRLYLISHAQAEPAILMGKTYQQTAPVDAPTGEALMNAFDVCLVRILTQLEEDLLTALPSSRPISSTENPAVAPETRP